MIFSSSPEGLATLSLLRSPGLTDHRQDSPGEVDPNLRIKYAKTDYKNEHELAQILQGVHTLLSFISPHGEESEATVAQKNLINASITAGVKRFAPSEWASSGIQHMSWYSFKGETRSYLAEINKEKQVLEYCLFQPGLFTDYLGDPENPPKHLKILETPLDFQNRRMLIRDGGEGDVVTWTTMRDVAGVVAKAVEYEGKWPLVGGIQGSKLSMGKLIALGEELRGKIFRLTVEHRMLIWRFRWPLYR